MGTIPGIILWCTSLQSEEGSSAGERLPAERCECLLATFYVVSRVEEDGCGLLVCQGLSQQFD